MVISPPKHCQPPQSSKSELGMNVSTLITYKNLFIPLFKEKKNKYSNQFKEIYRKKAINVQHHNTASFKKVFLSVNHKLYSVNLNALGNYI